MANSQNGWPVVPRTAVDEKPLIRDITVPNGMLAGDVALIFRWLAGQYDRRVERLRKGWCWGWYVKPIEGTTVISNHSSGTAVDFNAPDNPMGRGTTAKSLTQAQITQCHLIEDESGDVLRWGGDFSRNDPMHWEIVGSRAAVRAFAAAIRNTRPAREPAVQKMTVAMPLLREGDDDAKLDGYNLITRVQRIVGTDDDGIWGSGTTAAIARWLKKPDKDCRAMTEDMWRQLLGLSR